MKNDYLEHHGILGQRWGKKNGPPYPLDANDHSASEKNAHYRLSLKKKQQPKNETQPKKEQSDGWTKEQRNRAIKIGIGVAAGVAAIGVSAYLAKTGKLDDAIRFVKSRGKEIEPLGGDAMSGFDKATDNVETSIKSTINHKLDTFASTNGFKTVSKTYTTSEDSKLIASEMLEAKLKNGSIPDDYKNYCGHATTAWCLRRMGLDVTAKPMDQFTTGGMTRSEVLGPFRGATGSLFKDSDGKARVIKINQKGTYQDKKRAISKNILKAVDNQDTVGIIEVRNAFEGHFFGYTTKNGICVFENPANGSNADGIFAEMVAGRWTEMTINRIDDFDRLATGTEPSILDAIKAVSR